MPQATDNLRALMNKWFGSPISEQGPTQCLLSRGWTETNRLWTKPSPSYTVSFIEEACLIFLIEEWDFDFVSETFLTFDQSIQEYL